MTIKNLFKTFYKFTTNTHVSIISPDETETLHLEYPEMTEELKNLEIRSFDYIEETDRLSIYI